MPTSGNDEPSIPIAGAYPPLTGDAAAALAVRFADVASLTTAEAAARTLLEDGEWIATLPAPGDLPSGDRRDRAWTGVVLLNTPAVRVTMAVVDHRSAAARALSATVVVGGQVFWTRYLRAGQARLWRWRADRVDPQWHGGTAEPARPLSVQPLTDGAIVRIDGRRDAMLLLDPVTDIVSVTVSLRHDAAPFLREYDRVGGGLVRLATPGDGAGAGTSLPTLLHDMRHGDSTASGVMARDPALFGGSDAIRAWLASDARDGQFDPDRTRLP